MQATTAWKQVLFKSFMGLILVQVVIILIMMMGLKSHQNQLGSEPINLSNAQRTQHSENETFGVLDQAIQRVALSLDQGNRDVLASVGMLEIAIKEKNARERFLGSEDSGQFSRSGTYKSFLTFDLNIPSGYTEEDYLSLFKGTAMSALVPAAVAAEKKYGVNSLYILAHAAEESRWGTEPFAITRHNYFGYGAIDSNPTKALKFKSVEQGVFAVVQKIKENYLTQGGKFYNKRYGTTIKGMASRYASNVNWGINIARIMEKISKQLD